MGAFTSDRTQELTHTQDLLPLFQGFGDDAELLGGAELEIFLMRRADNGFARVSDYENFKLVEALRNDTGPFGTQPPIPVSQEPEASQIETQSRPHRLSEIHHVIEEIASHRAAIVRAAQQLEVNEGEHSQRLLLLETGQSALRPPQAPLYQGQLVACPFAVMPFTAQEQARVNILSPRGEGADYSDRPRVMIQAFARTMSREAALYPVTNTAVHFTHGVRDLRHAFEMTRLHAALLPFFFITTENRPPYIGNDDRRITHHTGLRARLALSTPTRENSSQRGLLPDFMFAARDEHDFLFRMIETVLDAPMLAYYDQNGRFTATPENTVITPRAMKGLGPQSVGQFELAMSAFWWSFKYKLPAKGGGLFHELRDFDSGPEVVGNIALIGGMLGLNDAARAQMIDILDKKYDLPIIRDPEAAQKTIRRNMYGVYHRGNPAVHGDAAAQHMMVPFGGKGHTMLDFLRADLLPLLEAQYRGTPAAGKLENLRFLAQTGQTNTQLWYDVFKDAASMKRAVYDLTVHGNGYNRFANQGKSWAQHYAEGNLPQLRPAA